MGNSLKRAHQIDFKKGERIRTYITVIQDNLQMINSEYEEIIKQAKKLRINDDRARRSLMMRIDQFMSHNLCRPIIQEATVGIQEVHKRAMQDPSGVMYISHTGNPRKRDLNRFHDDINNLETSLSLILYGGTPSKLAQLDISLNSGWRLGDPTLQKMQCLLGQGADQNTWDSYLVEVEDDSSLHILRTLISNISRLSSIYLKRTE